MGSIIICQIAGLIGSVFTMPAVQTWYQTLNKPSLTPPDWLFAPVWIFLFLLMGVSLFLIWRKGPDEREVRHALVIFGAQLILNILWSVLFFGLKSPPAAFIEIAVLWIMILLTIRYFYRISKAAGMLLVPYILWVSLAAFLNFSIWMLNT